MILICFKTIRKDKLKGWFKRAVFGRINFDFLTIFSVINKSSDTTVYRENKDVSLSKRNILFTR